MPLQTKSWFVNSEFILKEILFKQRWFLKWFLTPPAVRFYYSWASFSLENLFRLWSVRMWWKGASGRTPAWEFCLAHAIPRCMISCLFICVILPEKGPSLIETGREITFSRAFALWWGRWGRKAGAVGGQRPEQGAPALREGCGTACPPPQTPPTNSLLWLPPLEFSPWAGVGVFPSPWKWKGRLSARAAVIIPALKPAIDSFPSTHSRWTTKGQAGAAGSGPLAREHPPTATPCEFLQECPVQGRGEKRNISAYWKY